MIPIAFVDDHEGIRSAIIKLLGFTSPERYQFYEYEDGKVFQERFPTENYVPTLVLMDISMPEMNGYETTLWFKEYYPDVPVLIFSDIETADAMVMLVKCGADGYTSKQNIGKDNHLEDVIIKMIARKGHFDNPSLFKFAKERLSMPQKDLKEGIESLTPEEIKIIRFLDLEKKNEETAKNQLISHSTYKKRLTNVLKKLGLKSSDALFKYGVENGIKKI